MATASGLAPLTIFGVTIDYDGAGGLYFVLEVVSLVGCARVAIGPRQMVRHHALHTSTGHGGKFSYDGGEHRKFRVVAQGTPKE